MRPRIRNIKPEAAKDVKLWDAEQESGLPLYRAYTALWCQTDREGRFEWKPRELKLECLPWWDGDFEHVLHTLETWGFLVRYECHARSYGWIPTFVEHQNFNGKEPDSELPEPPVCITDPHGSHVDHTCETCAARVTDAPIPIHSRSNPIQSDPDPTRARGAPKRGHRGWTRVPSDWPGPNDKHREIALGRGVDVEFEAEKFRDHDFAKPKRDPDRTFANWLRNAIPQARLGASVKPFDPLERAERLRAEGR